MSILKKALLLAALAFAFLGSAFGAATAFSAHSATTQTHMLADTTPSTTCAGGGSGYCR